MHASHAMIDSSIPVATLVLDHSESAPVLARFVPNA